MQMVNLSHHADALFVYFQVFYCTSCPLQAAWEQHEKDIDCMFWVQPTENEHERYILQHKSPVFFPFADV